MKRFLALLVGSLLIMPTLMYAKSNDSSRCDYFKNKTNAENFIKKNPKSTKLAQATFCLGEFARRQYIKTKDGNDLKTALNAYERVARRFASSGLAVDSLFALGDLRRSGLKDEVAARSAYFEIIDRYPKSAAAAKKRLNPTSGVSTKSSATSKLSASITTGTQSEESRDILLETPHTVKASPKASQSPPTQIPVKEKEEPTKRVELSPSTTEQKLIPSKTPLPGTGKELIKDDGVTPKRPLIVIDPGHGGEDLGAKGVDGLLEKNVVLDISKELERLLKERLRAKTFLTRTTDVFIPLADRTRLANDRSADLFVSIHANASEYRTAQGIETYYLDNTNEKSSLKLADRENASLNFGPKQDSDLGFIFSDLIQNVKLDDSISLAHHLQNSLVTTLSRYYQGVNNLGVKKAPFYVLVGAHMPCVLSEISFIDHPMEGRRLGEERYQKLIAQSIFEGIRSYFIKREIK